LRQRYAVAALLALLILTAAAALLLYLNLSGEIGRHRDRAGELEAALDTERQVNRLLFQRLARAKYQARRYRGKSRENPAPGESAGSREEEGAGVEAGGKGALLDFEALRERFLAGDFNLAVELITPEGVEETLKKHGRSPDFLVAAAMVSPDREARFAYLEEALEKDPKSPVALAAYTMELIESGEAGEFLLNQIEALGEADPTNSLANYYEAHWKFQNGDVEGALEEMRQAAGKAYLNDYSTKLLSAREAFFRDGGCTEGVAKILAPLQIKLSHMGTLRELGRSVLEQSVRLKQEGNQQAALDAARSGIEMGNKLSSYGRFLIHDLVGIACARQGLKEERTIREALGQGDRVQEIDRQIQNNDERVVRAKVISNVLMKSLAEMSEAEILQYWERVLREGEFSAALDLPGVRRALEERAASASQ